MLVKCSMPKLIQEILLSCWETGQCPRYDRAIILVVLKNFNSELMLQLKPSAC